MDSSQDSMPIAASERLVPPDRETWQPFVYWKVIHAPAAYGVCVIANSRKEPILVAHGILRTELWRLLNDPAAERCDAYYFRAFTVEAEAEACERADEILRDLTEGGARPHRGEFPA